MDISTSIQINILQWRTTSAEYYPGWSTYWPDSSNPPELDRAHRALTAKPQPGSRSRPVILRLHRYQIKELIIREARKRRGKLQYQRSPIQIIEDYTPEVAGEGAKYRTVKADLYNLALLPALLFPARLQITLESGAKKRFSSPEEATTFVVKYQQAWGPISLSAILPTANADHANLTSLQEELSSYW